MCAAATETVIRFVCRTRERRQCDRTDAAGTERTAGRASVAVRLADGAAGARRCDAAAAAQTAAAAR